MKKLLLALSMIFALSACGEEETPTPDVDTTAPVISYTGDLEFDLEYGVTDFDLPVNATVTDDTDDSPTVVHIHDINFDVLGEYTFTIQANDDSDNVSTIDITVNIVDTEAPVITGVVNGSSTIEAGTVFDIVTGTVEDNYDVNKNATVVSNLDSDVPGVYTVTWSGTDSSGNEAVDVVWTITVEDTTIPVITNIDDVTISIEYGTGYELIAPLVTDNSSETVTTSVESNINVDVLGTYTVTYSAVDSSGNEAVDKILTVNVVDTQAPVLDIFGTISYTIGDGFPGIDNIVTAIDDYDGDVIDSITYDFNIENFLLPGEYALTLTVTDSSGNETSGDITVNAVIELVGLDSEELDMILNLSNTFSHVPPSIIYTNIGVHNGLVPNVGAGGNGYMEDGDIIYFTDFNQVTSDKFLDVVNTYNGSYGDISGYLAAILPALTSITDFDTEYEAGGFTFSLAKNTESQYVVNATGTVLGEVVVFEITIDKLGILGEFEYNIAFSTSFAAWDYTIVRNLSNVVSLQEVKTIEVNGVSVTYLNSYTFEDDGIQGYSFKDEASMVRRIYFETYEDYTSLFYENDLTGSINIQVLDANYELIFEYEDFTPNSPLGTTKARWFLTQFSGINQIELEESGFVFTTREYTINGTQTFDEDVLGKIEVKNYKVVEYDSLSEEYTELVSPTWVLRIDGEWATDQTDLLSPHPVFTENFSVDVETVIGNLETNKDALGILEIPAWALTKQDILDYINE